jgi:hypothetical protein
LALRHPVNVVHRRSAKGVGLEHLRPLGFHHWIAPRILDAFMTVEPQMVLRCIALVFVALALGIWATIRQAQGRVSNFGS